MNGSGRLARLPGDVFPGHVGNVVCGLWPVAVCPCSCRDGSKETGGWKYRGAEPHRSGICACTRVDANSHRRWRRTSARYSELGVDGPDDPTVRKHTEQSGVVVDGESQIRRCRTGVETCSSRDRRAAHSWMSGVRTGCAASHRSEGHLDLRDDPFFGDIDDPTLLGPDHALHATSAEGERDRRR
jgi:hypothetical protein